MVKIAMKSSKLNDSCSKDCKNNKVDPMIQVKSKNLGALEKRLYLRNFDLEKANGQLELNKKSGTLCVFLLMVKN